VFGRVLTPYIVVHVANRRQFKLFGMLGDGREMVLGDAPAAHHGDADFSADYVRLHRRHVATSCKLFITLDFCILTGIL
jgi:hypothetical protein